MLMVVSGIFVQKILHFPTILSLSNVLIFFSLVTILKMHTINPQLFATESTTRIH